MSQWKGWCLVVDNRGRVLSFKLVNCGRWKEGLVWFHGVENDLIGFFVWNGEENFGSEVALFSIFAVCECNRMISFSLAASPSLSHFRIPFIESLLLICTVLEALLPRFLLYCQTMKSKPGIKIKNTRV